MDKNKMRKQMQEARQAVAAREEARKAAPVATPVEPPVAEPIAPPVVVPVVAPVSEPIAPPVTAPVAAPVAAPVKPPVAEPIVPPVTVPVAAPVAVPVEPPVAEPIAPPVVVPVAAPVAAPVEPPVAEPIVPPVGVSALDVAKPLSHFTESSLYKAALNKGAPSDTDGYLSGVKDAVPGSDPIIKKFVVATLIEMAVASSSYDSPPTLKTHKDEPDCVKFSDTKGLNLDCTMSNCVISRDVSDFSICVAKSHNSPRAIATLTLSAIEIIDSDTSNECIGEVMLPSASE